MNGQKIFVRLKSCLARLVHVFVCFCYARRTRYSLDNVQVFRVEEAAVWSLLVFFFLAYILVPHFRLRFKSENCVCRLRFCMPLAVKSTTILPTICLSILKEERSPILKHNILLCQQTKANLLPKKATIVRKYSGFICACHSSCQLYF